MANKTYKNTSENTEKEAPAKEKKSWIKVFIEVLFDPKMVMLSDHLWRRVVEILLLAGVQGEGGKLPPMKYMARILGSSEKVLAQELEEIEDLEIVHKTGENEWVVTNYTKRQANPNSTERMREWRGSNPSHDKSSKISDRISDKNVTNLSQKNAEKSDRFVTEAEAEAEAEVEVEVEVEAEEQQPSAAAAAVNPWEKVKGVGGEVARAYSNNIGNITPMIADALVEMEQSYTAEWVLMAMKEAVRNNARNVKYIEAILKRWGVDGFKSRDDRGKSYQGKGGSGSGGLRGKEMDIALAEWVAEGGNG